MNILKNSMNGVTVHLSPNLTATDTQIRLNIGRTAELIQNSWNSVDLNAFAIVPVVMLKGVQFSLRQSAHFNASRRMPGPATTAR